MTSMKQSVRTSNGSIARKSDRIRQFPVRVKLEEIVRLIGICSVNDDGRYSFHEDAFNFIPKVMLHPDGTCLGT